MIDNKSKIKFVDKQPEICMCDWHMRFRRWFWHRIIGCNTLIELGEGLHAYCVCGRWYAKTINGVVEVDR